MIDDFGARRGVVRESKGSASEIGVFSIRARGGAVVKTVIFVRVRTRNL